MMTSSEDTAGQTAHDASALCQQCGLCCDGTLFSTVTVETGEFEETGLDVRESKQGATYFNLPCSKLSNCTCSIYTARPRVCRKFQCELQNKVMNGTQSLKEAKGIVTSVKALVESLEGWVRGNTKEGVENVSFWRYLDWYYKKTMRTPGNENFTVSDKDDVLNAFEYLKLVDRHFKEALLLPKFAELIQLFPSEDKS